MITDIFSTVAGKPSPGGHGAAIQTFPLIKSVDLWGLFALAFLVRAALTVWATIEIPEIFRWNLDTWEYMGMMLAIEEGDWGFYMFILRPPGYSLALTGFKTLTGITAPQMVAWFPIQAAFTSAAVVLGAQLVQHLTQQRRLALLTGIVLAVHPVFLAGDVPMVSEALFNALLLLAQLFFVRWLRSQRWREFFICVVALQWVVLTRATGQYYVLILLAAAIVYDRRLWRQAVLLALLFSIPVAVWIARNRHYTGISTYSTNSTYSMLFYRLVSTEKLITGDDPADIAWEFGSEIERRLTGDPDALPSSYPVGNYDYLYPQNSDRYRIMEQLRTEKLLETHVFNLVKFPAHLFNNFGRNYVLQRLHPAWKWISVCVGGLSFLLFGLGVIQWFRVRRPAWQHILVVGTISYFMLGSTLFMGIPDARLGSSTGLGWALFIALGSLRVLEEARHVLRNR